MSLNGLNDDAKTNLSVLVTAHSEGILLHRTLRSALRAVNKLDKRQIDWELLIHVDNATRETLDYIEANKDFLKPFTIFQNSFGDLSASRNFMVKQAKGSVIAFLDADDLISENWFADGFVYLREFGQPAVLHTEWLINFGKQHLVWQKYDSRSKEEDALNMVWANRWDSAVMAPREIFEKFPYAPNTNGFGSEDWHFGSQTLSAGIPHRVVPETIIFARRREVSEMSIQQTDYRTVHYTDLLDIEYVKNIDINAVFPNVSSSVDKPRHTAINSMKLLAYKAAKKAYHAGAGIQALEPFIRIAKERYSGNKPQTSLPAWLVAEWRRMHTIDKQVFPDEHLLKHIPKYVSEMYELGIAYHNLLQHVTKQPDYIVIVPHLVAGGADLVILNYVRIMRKLHPEWHILVIATDNTPSPWATRLPAGVDYMPWGQVCAESGIWQDLHLQLFARMIVQLRCTKLHIIQSSLGFKFAEKYKSLLAKNNYTVYACTFCEDIDNEGRFIGHIHSGLPGAYPSISKIFTDNKAVIDQLVYEYGYDPRKFEVHYQPAEVRELGLPKQQSQRPYRILWASRITTQKRPDILQKIAAKLDPTEFRIDAYGSLHDGFTADDFSDSPALSYKGTFNGLQSIDTSAYNMFLYTSANDGVPNILLGIAASGLPVVASNAGGVGEFIHNGETGLLINNIEDIGAYVDAIQHMRSNPDKACTYAVKAQKLLQDRHSEEAFEQVIRNAEL